MFDHIGGLRPGQAARWTALAEECVPVLADGGMEAVQHLLAERGAGLIEAIAITRALLGWAETPLHTAAEIVTTSTARTVVGDAN
ncbi:MULTISPECIES: hypothetical protein [Streptomyces]|uniref:hypothetical protein n=1 Tax=Streptomyces scabiei TaxID=1930 RepID=UPI0004E78BF7|nr:MULTISPECIES: hypothetical protein [Streptomyces]KFG03907.1 hypothetical protein IQ61_38190 [Streptomyces scabiei]MBP5911124.1 hypothetical protein [Streptomyces sp. LBUM 1486]MDX2533179.1 hypothetical protein [Streptomyces scabiei]MDX2798309.1 hypothetical protein [Streptomyces scabiei]MDX2832475.1 hypothetical protein [Streptomyces scabiei]